MTKQIGGAILKSTQNLLPNAKVSYLDDFDLKEKWWMDNTYGVLYDVVDPKVGYMHSDVPGTKGDNSCYFYPYPIGASLCPCDKIHQYNCEFFLIPRS